MAGPVKHRSFVAMANLPLLIQGSSDNFVSPMRTKDEIATLVGQRIRSLRLTKNLSMEDLALESGMDYSQISRIERGKINTSVYQIYLITSVLKISVHDVFEEII
jgi:ribosome-binding protein aMBF1 (putative translation factor)